MTFTVVGLDAPARLDLVLRSRFPTWGRQAVGRLIAGRGVQVNDKTVVRASWGLFFSLDRGGIDNQLTENPPYTLTQYRFGGPGSSVRLSDPIPLPVAVDPNNPVLADGSGVVYVPRDNPVNQYQQFNLGFQRELSDKTAVSVFYVGTRGDNLTAVLSQAGFSGSIQTRLTTVSNVATSSYDSLQLALRRTSATDSGSRATSLSPNSKRPSSTGTKPAIARSSVVLPQPLGPRSVKNVPGSIASDKLSITRLSS